MSFELTHDESNIVNTCKGNITQAEDQLNNQLLIMDGLIARLAIQHQVNQLDYALNLETLRFEPRAKKEPTVNGEDNGTTADN